LIMVVSEYNCVLSAKYSKKLLNRDRKIHPVFSQVFTESSGGSRWISRIDNALDVRCHMRKRALGA
jgi:hypothetical protein